MLLVCFAPKMAREILCQTCVSQPQVLHVLEKWSNPCSVIFLSSVEIFRDVHVMLGVADNA